VRCSFGHETLKTIKCEIGWDVVGLRVFAGVASRARAAAKATLIH
jgi:hypothetical protein